MAGNAKKCINMPGSKGFTLIELIVSLAILLIISVPLSQLILQGSFNNMHTRNLEQATQLGQTMLEEVLYRESIATMPETARIAGATPYGDYEYTLQIAERTNTIPIAPTGAAEPTTPVEVIDGTTGQRQVIDLNFTAPRPVAQNNVTNANEPVTSAIENYSFARGNLFVRDSAVTTQATGMDVIYHLTAANINLQDIDSTETTGASSNVINVALLPDAGGAAPRQISIARGGAPDIINVARAAGRARIAFIIENDTVLRNLRLASRIPDTEAFGIDVFIIRGASSQTPLTYFSGNVIVGTETRKALDFSIAPGDSTTQTPSANASPKFVVREGYYVPPTTQNAQMLYDVTIRVFRSGDPAGSNPICELRTTTRRRPM